MRNDAYLFWNTALQRASVYVAIVGKQHIRTLFSAHRKRTVLLLYANTIKTVTCATWLSTGVFAYSFLGLVASHSPSSVFPRFEC